MIFAAGLGTRLKPLTDHLPKALVEVGGKPLLVHVIEKLTAAGFTDITINVHHFADLIEEYVRKHYNDDDNDNDNDDESESASELCSDVTRSDAPRSDAPRIRFSDERAELLETGGGLRHARSSFHPDTPVLIHNVDILSNVDLSTFYAQASDHDAVLLVSERDTQRYLLFDDDMRLVGWTNIKTGEVRGRIGTRRYAFSGIHAIGHRLLKAMDSYPARFPIIDFYLDQCLTHDIHGIIKHDLRLMDVGKLDTLDQATEFINTLNTETQRHREIIK